VPSFTSSSSRPVPPRPWLAIVGVALLAGAALVALMELELARRGVRATFVDSGAAWQAERIRAARTGERVLALVGASRMQLAADLQVLRERTPFEPVQLAMDGTSFVPLLDSLAKDETFRGWVVVYFSDHALAEPGGAGAALAAPVAVPPGALPDFAEAEARLAGLWRRSLRSYADAARPITSLELRIVLDAFPQYLITLPDRSRLADFSRGDAPRRMVQILRRAGLRIDAGADPARDAAAISAAVAAEGPALERRPVYDRETERVAAMAAALQRRGARVFFVLLPRSGFVRELEERRYPRQAFWDRFAARVGAPTLRFEDIPGMRELVCPDGSHLDLTQRAAFTRALVEALALDRPQPAAGKAHAG